MAFFSLPPEESETASPRHLIASPVMGYTLVVGIVLVLNLIVPAILPLLFSGLPREMFNIIEALLVTTMSAPFLWLLVVTPLEQSVVFHSVRSEEILANIGEGVVTFNKDGLIESSNLASERMFGHPSRLDGMPLTDFFPKEAMTRIFGTDAGRLTNVPTEIICRRRDGSPFPAELAVSGMTQQDRVIGIAVIRDITERKKAEEQVLFLSNYDTITSLPNRTLFQDRLAQSLAHSERYREQGCILFLDIDNFKLVNEVIGHQAGDDVIALAAARLGSWIGKGDTIARIGGNQFGFILHNISSETAAAAACEAVQTLLSQPFRIGERDIYLGASIGIALFPEGETSVEPVLRKAEAALQHAKRSGKNSYQFYCDQMNDKVSEKLSLETSLRRAVENNQLVLHYQPRLDLDTGTIVAVEALARWEDPELGMVPPQKFIPLAEENGLIIPVGEWVLREACSQLAAWVRDGITIKMSVNVSPIQLRQPEFAATVSQIIREAGLDPSLLELEITETSAMENAEESIAGFERLRNMGVGLAIDDFGTGYSSLSYLTKLPVDILKIDRSFVRDLPDCADGVAIARTIISMAHALGLKVVAEGVESDQQLDFLRSHACQEMQGFLFSTAVSADEMAKMLKAAMATAASQ